MINCNSTCAVIMKLAFSPLGHITATDSWPIVQEHEMAQICKMMDSWWLCLPGRVGDTGGAMCVGSSAVPAGNSRTFISRACQSGTFHKC